MGGGTEELLATMYAAVEHMGEGLKLEPKIISEMMLSNWRELAYLVVWERGLSGCEISLFTDNATSGEAVYWKGNSRLQQQQQNEFILL